MENRESITRDDYLMGRDDEYTVSSDMYKELLLLLNKINALGEQAPIEFRVRSGWRPGKYNVAAGGAKNSCHLTCQAVDLADDLGKLKNWLVQDFKDRGADSLLVHFGLYMEHPNSTPTWVHLQTRPTKNRIFIP